MVPQFIDAEDKIFGPITTRQFLIILVGGGAIFIVYKLFAFWSFAISALVIFALTGALAFLRVNGMPFHFFLLNLAQTFRHPRLQVWDKSLTTAELRATAKAQVEPPPPAPPSKPALSATKLQELSLVVNTGGVYQAET
ncbi:MAG: PrgI family protein [bacterium]|nr:PrgI family protein [bacterium]